MSFGSSSAVDTTPITMLKICRAPRVTLFSRLSCCSGLITENAKPAPTASRQNTTRNARIFIRTSCVTVAIASVHTRMGEKRTLGAFEKVKSSSLTGMVGWGSMDGLINHATGDCKPAGRPITCCAPEGGKTVKKDRRAI